MKSNEYYTKEELEQIQSLESNALKVLLRVCEKINVECFLVGGTALGAIRHNGFIPWDDDIDVAMTRKDYNTFLSEAPQFLPSQYYLQTPYNDKKNPYFYSKLRINGTKFVEYCNRKLKIHHGVYIDIFPYDEVPDDDIENKKHFEKAQRMFNLFQLRQAPDMSKKADTLIGYVKMIIRKVLHMIVRIIPHDYLIKIIDEHIQKYNGTGQKAIACMNVPVWKAEYIKKVDLYPLIYHKFEDIEALIPNKYDVYLRTHYGDYMQLPPEEKRFAHKPCEVKLD